MNRFVVSDIKEVKLKQFARAAIPVLTVLGFVIDLYTPQGVDDWVWYFVALALTLFVGERTLPIALASLYSLMTLVGFCLSPLGEQPGLALINCFMGMCVLWIAAALIYLGKRQGVILAESEENFRSMFELASVGMGQADPETGRWVRVNKKMCEITGYSMEELVKMRVSEVTHPEDRDRDWSAYQKVVRGEESSYHMEKRYVRKDGTIVWVNVNAALVRDGVGQPLRMMATIEDITERRKSDDRIRILSTAVEQSPVSILITDKAGRMQYVNPKFCEVTGYSVEECIGQNPRILKSAEMSDEGYKELWEAVTAGKQWRGEFHNKKKNGELFWELAAISPIFDASGKITNYLGVKEDITERKRLEAQFLRAQRLESIGALASGVAHDLNNVLAPVLMTAPLLRDALPESDADHRDLVDMIESCAQRGSDIIKQLLTFARGAPGARVPLPARHLVRDMQKIIEETFPRDISACVQMGKDLWPMLGDATQVHQTLLNLCVNARDAMPNGGTLSLGAENVALDEKSALAIPGARPGNFVCLKVGDTGSGIPKENLERIFDPFFTTKEVGKGTGLGLATVLGIVRGHEGFVHVRSKVGHGTTFELYFPAKPGTVSEHAIGDRPIVPRGDRELILLVDDEPAICDSLRRTLETRGYRVLTACQGAEALTTFSQHRTDVRAVLTDMMMPVMNGPMLIQALRGMEPNLVILGMTGLPDRKSLNGLEALHLETILTKPFTNEALVVALRDSLHKHDEHPENNGLAVH